MNDRRYTEQKRVLEDRGRVHERVRMICEGF
jgi:hypothetical protein